MPAKILICDNEEMLRALVRAALGSAFDVIEARDGDESLQRARAEVPDVIVLDMMMPGRTGLEVVRELRSDPSLTRIPVVMLTARAQATDRDAASAAGVDCFLTKPFSPLELAAIVGELAAKGT